MKTSKRLNNTGFLLLRLDMARYFETYWLICNLMNKNSSETISLRGRSLIRQELKKKRNEK